MTSIDVVNTRYVCYKTFYDFIYQLVKYNDPPSCVTSTMYFWTHTKWESDSTASHSKRNSREAREITEVAKTFCEKGGVSPSKITVLCSYRGQVGVCTDVKRCLSCKLVKGAVSRFYHGFERFKNTTRSYITQQKWFYFGQQHSTNDDNPLGSEDG